tara:strand:+ start:198 stop:365 length:168 start_codon:yes stop_codon:yes gene_type:complete
MISVIKKVPKGMKSRKTYFQTNEFNEKVNKFKKNCGVYRDIKKDYRLKFKSKIHH